MSKKFKKALRIAVNVGCGFEGDAEDAAELLALITGLESRIAELAQAGAALPPVLNIAAPLPVGMAELLEAGGISWQWGPHNPAVLARLVLDTTLLEALCPGLAGPGSARALMQELRLEEEPAR